MSTFVFIAIYGADEAARPYFVERKVPRKWRYSKVVVSRTKTGKVTARIVRAKCPPKK